MTRLLIASAIVVLIGSPGVYGQTDVAAQGEHTARALRAPSLDATFLGPEEEFKIEAEKGEQKASLKLSFAATTDRNFHVLVSAPVNKNAEQQSLTNLHGLTGSSKLELGFNTLLTKIGVTIDPDRADALCKKHGKDPGCDVVKLQDLERDPASQAATFTGMSTALAVKAEYTRTKFDYLTKGTLASNSDNEPQYAGSAAYGVLPHKKLPIGVLYFAGVGIRYESGYEAQKKQQICRPLDGSPAALTCGEASIGAPTRSLKRIAELRTRWYPSDDVVFDVVLSRDLNKDVSAVEIPVALIRGKDNLFTGGVSIGWRSDTDEVTASVFIGALKNVL